jgi:hypothetical protein
MYGRCQCEEMKIECGRSRVVKDITARRGHRMVKDRRPQ